MECTRKHICYHYPSKCDLCATTSDIINCYPCFQDKDIVGVVRCKDCKFSEHWKGDELECRCPHTPWATDEYAIITKANDFCSYGERSENE